MTKKFLGTALMLVVLVLAPVHSDAKTAKPATCKGGFVLQGSTCVKAVVPKPKTPVVKKSVPATNCVIKGNISSAKEKIYHLPGCSSYSQTIIDTGAGEMMFCTEAAARAAGWRKALNCPK